MYMVGTILILGFTPHVATAGHSKYDSVLYPTKQLGNLLARSGSLLCGTPSLDFWSGNVSALTWVDVILRLPRPG